MLRGGNLYPIRAASREHDTVGNVLDKTVEPDFRSLREARNGQYARHSLKMAHTGKQQVSENFPCGLQLQLLRTRDIEFLFQRYLSVIYSGVAQHQTELISN